jgi:hypothetical protein
VVIATIVTQMKIGGIAGTGTIIGTITIETMIAIEASGFSSPIKDLLGATI